MKSEVNSTSTILTLILIFVLFLVTRLHLITTIPSSLYWDEASIGINAYSILKTGRDEWGQFLPLHFQAFGEFKLPVYIYSVAFLESVFGLDPLSVRLPAVLFGLGCVILLFFISKIIFRSNKIGLLSAFFFAISPWFFLFSRTGYEASAGLMFFLLGILLCLLCEKRPVLLVGVAASFLLAVYSYNSFRIIVPLVGFYFFLYFFLKKRAFVRVNWKYIFIALIIFLVGILPILNVYFFYDGLKRLDTVGVFQMGLGKKDLVVQLIENYIRSFDFRFLFLSGDQNLRSNIGESGELFWLQFPFIVGGLIVLFKNWKELNGWKFFVIYLLIIGPIPAVLTKEVPHALRSLLLVIPFSILSGLGLYYLGKLPKYPNFLVLSFTLLFLFLFSVFYYRFLVFYPAKSAQQWQNEYTQFFSKYSSSFDNYDTIIVSDRYLQPYVYYMFYSGIDPKIAQETRILNSLPRKETSLIKKIGKVRFEEIHIEDFLPNERTLIFSHASEPINELVPIETIWNPDKSVASYIYEYAK